MYREIIIKVLKNVPMFNEITQDSILKLSYLAKLSQYNAGAVVFNEGDPGDCLYIIASGKVGIYARTDNGDEISLKDLDVAEVFGEMSLLDGLPRSATVKVHEKTLLFHINRTDFNLFLIQNPEVSLKLIETVSRRLRDTNKRLKDLTDINENLRITLMDTFATASESAEKPPDDNRFYREEYMCPYCGMPVSCLRVKKKYLDLQATDDDFCPHYTDLNPIFYEIAVCPHCGYAFNDSILEKLNQQTKKTLEEKLDKIKNIPDLTGPRSIEQAFEAYNQAYMVHYDRKISHFIKADICLKLAWLYRYKNDRENERKNLLAAQQRFLAAYEEEKYEDPQQDLHLLYMIGQIHLNCGNSLEALKWFARITQHPQKDLAVKLVEKAREQWQTIKQKQNRK